MMPDDFAALILTHKRPDRQYTVDLLRRSGYTGKVYLVVDDQDPTLPEYQRRYGDMVIVFDKREAWAMTDDADNTGGMKGVVYARNMCWSIAKRLGLRHFIELDDDYTGFALRFNSKLNYGWFTIKTTLDSVIKAMVQWLDDCPQLTCVAMSQGGDHIGGSDSSINRDGCGCKRKVMNTFVCSVDRPFNFYGRINEDATAYVTLGRRGQVFLTALQIQCRQLETQTNAGGLTEIYLDAGTYYKSFLSVMWEPSCVKVSAMGSPEKGQAGHYRLHHWIDWKRAVPCIVRESLRKPDEVPDGY